MKDIIKKSFGPSTAILLVCLILTPAPSTALVEDVLDIIHVAKEVLSGILHTWKFIEEIPISQNIDLPIMREKQKKVLQRLQEVSSQIDYTVDKQAEYTTSAIEATKKFFENNFSLMAKRNDLLEIMAKISSRFKLMKKYEANKDKLEMTTLIQFAEWTVYPNSYSLHHLMDSLHIGLFGEENQDDDSKNLLYLMAKAYENYINSQIKTNDVNERAVLDICETALRNDKTYSMSRINQDIESIMVKQAMYYRAMMASNEQICETKQSPQQFVYSLYTDIALTELKGYVMMEFSWMMLKVYGKGNFTQESQLMREEYEKRTTRTLNLLRKVMERTDRILWRCDPDEYVKGKTYDEVTRLLQGYIENEVDLNGDETCRETCDFYQSTRSQGCFKQKFCSRQAPCTGRLYECQFVQSDMFVCQAPMNSSRRYDFIEYESGRTLGEKTSCTRGYTKVDSWWRYFFWHCSYCFCLCDEMGIKSDRYINLREYVSDVQINRVVIGLRFVKINRIFHLQIQEGELLPRGAINTSSITWKPVDDYKVYDRNVKSGVDYHTLNYQKRSIDLDDIYTDDSAYVVTGVRFRMVGAHINLEARLSEFDFETGKMGTDAHLHSFWKSNDNTDVSGDEKRVKIKLTQPNVPTRTVVKSILNSRHNQYIEFVNTSMDKDASQTTVPFIDIQTVESNPPVPLSGIGIYHKGRPGYGGFLAPKIMTYDFSPHVRILKSTE